MRRLDIHTDTEESLMDSDNESDQGTVNVHESSDKNDRKHKESHQQYPQTTSQSKTKLKHLQINLCTYVYQFTRYMLEHVK